MQVRPRQAPAHAPRRVVGVVVAASEALLVVERRLVMALMALLVALILLNVLTRYGGFPIFWIDESAVFAVVWLAFIGASAMTRLRMDFAVTLLTERVGARTARIARVTATAAVTGFALALAAMCWFWLDPVGIARAGFDARDFAAESFNFVYTERTQTLGWPSWAVQLCIPLFAVTVALHGTANLLEDLGLAEPVSDRDIGHGAAEAVT